MFKKPSVYVNVVLSLVALAFFINAFNLPGHTLVRNTMAAIASISGEGTVNYLPRFAGASATSYTLGDSIIFDDAAGHIGINTIAPGNLLTVNQSSGATAATVGTYGLAVNIAGSQYVTLGADTNYAYLQSWNAKPLYINSQGNNTIFGASVGIGTTAPTAKLSFGTYYINTATPTADQQTSHIRLYDTGNGGINYGIGVSTSALNIAANQSTGTIRLYTNSSERVRVDNSGNVGIGTTTPGYKLDVTGTININGDGNYIRWGAGDAQISETGYKLGFSTWTGSALTEKMSILGNGNVGIGTATPNGKLVVVGDITTQLNANGAVRYGGPTGYYSFITRNTGWNEWGISLLGVDSDSSNDAIGTDLFKIDYTGLLRIPGVYNNTTASTNYVAVAADGLVARSSSSLRFKKDIERLTLPEAKSAIMQLSPVTYRSKTDADQRRWPGFIAEEVAQFEPLLVTYSEPGMKGTTDWVSYDRITSYLVPVVQDHEARLADQQKQIDELKKEIEILKNK